MKVLRFLLFLLVVSVFFFAGAGKSLAQSCTGYGICCRQNGFRCVRDGNTINGVCNASTMGQSCGPILNPGICQCAMSYTVTCSASCVANACNPDDYLIEDYCFSTWVDQGCGVYGCPPTDRRICVFDAGWSCGCYYDPLCVPATPTPVPTSTPMPVCPAYVACPTACGTAASYQPDGSCGTHYCGATVSCCTVTVPTGLSAVKTGSPATYRFSWTAGPGGNYHLLYICTDAAMTSCLINGSVAKSPTTEM